MRSRAPGLYLHIPFCSAICPYCDFYVLTGGTERHRHFFDSLEKECELWKNDWKQPFETIYLGGGTPSALSPQELERLFETVERTLPLTESPWIQFEANPEDTNRDSVLAWRNLGIDTLSLGIQSFNDQRLGFLGRRHSSSSARESVRVAKTAGFSTLSIDLIFGLPEQSPMEWRSELEAAVALEPDHVSCYQLTIHERTSFGYRRDRGQLSEMPNGQQAELFRLTHSFLADHGYEAYEVSNFARGESHRSRHNQKYWDHVPYLGLGPSAHSFRGRSRWWNERKIPSWQKRLANQDRPIAGSENLTNSQLALEAIMLGLRTSQGVDLEAIGERYQVEVPTVDSPAIVELIEGGFLTRHESRIVPTLDGLAIADTIVASLPFP